MIKRTTARKRFGQHFLSDSDVISSIVSAVAPAAGDTLVEIGPGRGALTLPLSRYDITLHAVEFDRDLVVGLRAEFAANDRISIHEADALTFDFHALGDDLRVVGNLPYNISTPLLFRLIQCRDVIRDFHFMLQKEVVDRMAALPGGKDFGRLTVMIGCYLEVVPLFEVPPHAFSPPPKVQSTVVRLRPHAPARWHIANPALLTRVVAAAFSKRRKTLRNALKGIADANILAKTGLDASVRPEAVPIEDWIRLANELDA